MEPIGHGIVRTTQDSTLLVVIVGLFRYFCPVLQHWLHRFQLWCWQSVCEVHVEDATWARPQAMNPLFPPDLDVKTGKRTGKPEQKRNAKAEVKWERRKLMVEAKFRSKRSGRGSGTQEGKGKRYAKANKTRDRKAKIENENRNEAENEPINGSRRENPKKRSGGENERRKYHRNWGAIRVFVPVQVNGNFGATTQNFQCLSFKTPCIESAENSYSTTGDVYSYVSAFAL